MCTIKVLLADDHRIVRQGVRALLEAETDMEVVGEVEHGQAVAAAVDRLHPDMLILDLMMPDMNGLDVARVVHAQHPEVRIVVLSMHSNEAYVMQALRNGAYGYVLKDASSENLVTAIRRTLGGHSYLCPPLQELVTKAKSMNLWNN
jgi:DNA-binding NarL/FixJ family response regulator